MDFISRSLIVYLRYRHTLSPIIFLITFIVDIATFPLVDTSGAIFLASLYALLTLFLVLIFARSAEADIEFSGLKRWQATPKVLLDIALQFTFGAFSSVLFASYLRGSDIVAALPFLLILFVFVTGNEFARNHRSKLWLRFSATLFLCYTYLLYLVPLLRNQLGYASLLISTAGAFLIALIMLALFRLLAPNVLKYTRLRLHGATLAILVGVPLLIATGSIPPLPLMLSDGTVAHNISRTSNGNYLLHIEPQKFYAQFGIPKLLPHIHIQIGEELTFFTAIYVPVDIRTNIVHQWEQLDVPSGKYVVRSSVPLSISGGRQNGYRTYSTVSITSPGTWRVTALIAPKQVIGRRTFIVENAEPQLIEVVK